MSSATHRAPDHQRRQPTDRAPTSRRRQPTDRAPLSFKLLDWGLVPDPVLRKVCDLRVAKRLRTELGGTPDEAAARARALRTELAEEKITTHTAEANAQHYEVPAGFFTKVLGPALKYSSCYWGDGAGTLAEAETAMLELTARRAGVADGQRIMDLGCGWGSFCLWAAERYPASEIVAVSNSATQREFIEARATERGLDNLTVVTTDVAVFDPADHGVDGPYDRIVSVEMLEHVRNHGDLFARVARWLAPDGRFFVHVFSGRLAGFRYEAGDRRDWMGRYFFSGGLMPSDDLFLHRQDDLVYEDHWWMGGEHYHRTAEAWLDNLDAHRREIVDLFSDDVGRRRARVWFRRWKAFFMGCSSLWGHHSGADFGVSHYRFAPRPALV